MDLYLEWQKSNVSNSLGLEKKITVKISTQSFLILPPMLHSDFQILQPSFNY